ncbi:hypothetical protein Gocc_2925 [Gaiella occulta]|uniref:Lipoprotein n=1 Tax=Gaiella occulta TaxID=1002870 RepID=A0A7M2YTH2_9ACTN|nr:hypothetical protein [Gaiella occulta]RDI73325.1 hypothetical protein Gocc_2925 [Gaiella occulta]
MKVVGSWVHAAVPLAAAAVALAGCGGSSSMSSSDVEQTFRSGFNAQAKDGYSATAVDCVRKQGNEYTCLATIVDTNAEHAQASFSVTCEGERCIWQADKVSP